MSGSSSTGPGSPQEIVLQVTITQPVGVFKTEFAIDANAVEDERSAVDQFVSTIEALNVLLGRYGASAEFQPPDDAETAMSLDSLFSLSDDDEEQSPDVESEGHESPQFEVAEDASVIEAAADSREVSSAAIGPAEDDVKRQLNNLVLLGYISAVESYFRCLTRHLVWVDDFTADKVKDLKISYGAALHVQERFLPEAFLEDMSFITAEAIRNWMSGVIGVASQGLEDALNEYERICQLRHCIVHRFGRLGPKNALRLGLDSHRGLFEKPIKLSALQLEEIAFILLNFVRLVNNHVYAKVLERSAKLGAFWTWDVETDMPRFETLFNVFRKTSEPGPSPSPDSCFDQFMAKCKQNSLSEKRRQEHRRRGLP